MQSNDTLDTKLYYLSSVSEEGFNDACLVEETGFLAAVARAQSLDILSPGQVSGYMCEESQVPGMELNKRYVRTELAKLFEVTTLGELKDEEY